MGDLIGAAGEFWPPTNGGDGEAPLPFLSPLPAAAAADEAAVLSPRAAAAADEAALLSPRAAADDAAAASVRAAAAAAAALALLSFCPLLEAAEAASLSATAADAAATELSLPLSPAKIHPVSAWIDPHRHADLHDGNVQQLNSICREMLMVMAIAILALQDMFIALVASSADMHMKWLCKCGSLVSG